MQMTCNIIFYKYGCEFIAGAKEFVPIPSGKYSVVRILF